MEAETKRILENIRKIRLKKKISGMNLALDVGISHSHLYYIESMRVSPSIDVLVRIAKSLNVPLGELIDLSD